MSKKNISELTNVIRSKNAGPYQLTFDLIFKEFSNYELVKNLNIINKEKISNLYGISEDKIVSIIPYDPAKAIKITILRPWASGSWKETDVYGAQQHAPLLNIEIPFED
ncbi:DUF4387 domain-containing protein [Halarsenatibacter silvermanii]|uniref:DUF4387 domain-containing protein n=1 Tax=Halarsenatibacter silvermanii TaxID=321763 RepID=A0A1G9TEG2_9FIRM|nr:DUF4387 domain-containing protein [Halarsenatibacter silvermanii]SDM46022.1 protein of unknown function [Halarsenatibacter silvermanii]